MRIIDQIAVTTSAVSDEYVFTVCLSRLELARRSHRKILGFSFPKEKYEFLNEIAELLTAEILEKLQWMTHE